MAKDTHYRDVIGVRMPKGFPEEAFKSALNYKAKPGEIFIVTYPKCGTSWMQNIVLLILRKGKTSDDPLDFFLGCPFLEVIGTEYVEKAKSPVMKTHFPYHAVPYSDKAKYIYVARNPKDCCVSYYHHMKLLSSKFKELTFNEFFQSFLNDELGYSGYFEHLLEWYNHRNDKNVYFVTYENLKKDIGGEILKIAKFIGEEYEKCILEDPKMMEDIVYYSSFEYMKKDTNKAMDLYLNNDKIFRERDIPAGLIETMKNISEDNTRGEDEAFIRKGIVGDWKNYFSDEQMQRLEEKIAEKTEGSDVMSLWKDV